MNRFTKGFWVSGVIMTLLFSSFSSFAQKKKSSKGSSSSYNWGIGVKLGDPSGISIKKYNGNKAWELIIGRSGYYWGDANNYGTYYFDHSSKYNGNGYHYVGSYNYSTPIAIQLRHIFFHKDISGLDGLRWYLGAGGQFRQYSYNIQYWDNNYINWYDRRVSSVGIGVDGVVGLEYTFKEIPLSIGLDANLYMELFEHPFYFIPQGGVAVRYNF